MKDTLEEKYKKVFDKDGNIKACGRNTCIDLIKGLEEEYPGVDFGNNKTGFLNVDAVQKYFKKGGK